MTEALAPIRLGPRMVLASWRDITRQQFWTTFLLGCALFNYYSLTMDPPGDLQDGTVRFATVLAAAFAILLAIAVADRATGKDPDRRGAYAIAVVTGALVGGVLEAQGANWLWNLFVPQGSVPDLGAALYLGFELVLLGGGIVWIVNDRRRAQRARERTHAAELERIAAQKRSIESDLQAMQARVEPQFLFNTLAQVRDLYREDATRGEHMLDELIAYLRAAMPKMRDSASTLGQELEFVRAYLAIVKLRLADRLEFSIDASPADADARVPPMMLLPLVDHAIAHGIAESRAKGKIRIRASVSGDRVRLAIVDSGAGLMPGSEGEGIAGIRERLEALYEHAASLMLHRREGGATEAVLEIPLEGVTPPMSGG
jgi:signal transduction histidine kinase